MPLLPCYEVALEDKENAINSLSQRNLLLHWLEWVGLGRPL